MADAFVSFALENLNSIIQQERKLVAGVRKEIERLSSALSAIRAVLSDAERRQVKEESVRDWLAKLKDVAYEVDDVLDAWRTEALKSQIHQSNTKVHATSLRSPFVAFNQVALRHNIGTRIKNLREKLDTISAEKNNYHFGEDGTFETTQRHTSSIIDEREIYGRNQDKEMIISLLLGGENLEERQGVPMVSIVGVGGVGKTTLAQMAYNDEEVKTHFDMRIWVCVSEDFNVLRLTKSIIEDVTGIASDLSDLNPLQQSLLAILSGRRFLLVLDDVWEEDNTKWEILKLPLQHGAEGSRVVVTTRNEKVVTNMGTTHLYTLGVLPHEDCWSLFSYKAFTGKTVEECLNLEKIGKDIVKKCKGVPLAAKVIGSVMRSKRTKREWEHVLKSEVWGLEEVGKGIYPALLLSYYNLPPNLKQCFTYCSIYPKGSKIEYGNLIKLWMAQGFISPKGDKEIEEIGGEYFNDLISHSLFHDVLRDEDGNVVNCRMHDIVHDLAQVVANGECHVIKIGVEYGREMKARHLSRYGMAPIVTGLYRSNALRTLLLLEEWAVKKVPRGFFTQLRCLRVLDLSNSYIEELSSSLEKLIHLRYLDVSRTNIKELPESVTSLCNLQTLRLNYCNFLQKLPSRIGKLINLRHLEIEYCSNLCYFPKSVERLSSLRTLSKFIVGEKESECKIGALKDLNLLQGEVIIFNLERVVSRAEANEAQLELKTNLHRLVLCCDDRHDISGGEVDAFEGLRPNPNLIELDIVYYMGCKFPSWMEDSEFSNLIRVQLYNCYNCIQLPALGKLPSLKYLSIEGITEMRQVGRDLMGIGGVFPKLETLNFCNMLNLEEWELRIEDGEMPCLYCLRFEKCPNLKAPPQLLPYKLTELHVDRCGKGDWSSCVPPFVETLTLKGLDEMQLRQLPSLYNLKFLQMANVQNLMSLPDGFGELKKLETLVIATCNKLSCLSELQHLTSLQRLSSTECPLLEQRYKTEVGEDWHKISHIPIIHIY